MTTTTLCFIDTEATGLDARIHQPYEVAWWREDEAQPAQVNLPHTLEHADPTSLAIGHYFDRGFAPWGGGAATRTCVGNVARHLQGVTLVGANPGFDAAMLTRFIGTQVWHHRMIDVSTGAMWLLGWDRPRGLLDTALALRDRGYEIPEPDHTALGDVRTTRAVYDALRAEQAAIEAVLADGRQ